MSTKELLVQSFNKAVEEHGENHPIVTKLKNLISQHYTDLRDKVANPSLFKNIQVTETPTTAVGGRSAISLGEYIQKKTTTQAPTNSVAVKPQLREDDVAPSTSKTNALDESVLKELAAKSADDILKELGIDKLKDAAIALGFTISNKLNDKKYALAFKAALEGALE